MDDKTYRRITSESKRERVNRLNGMIVAKCVACGAGFTSFRNAECHSCEKMPGWEVNYERVPARKKTGYSVYRGTYTCRAPSEAIASRFFWKRHHNKNCNYLVTSIERLAHDHPKARSRR